MGQGGCWSSSSIISASLPALFLFLPSRREEGKKEVYVPSLKILSISTLLAGS